MTVSQTFFILGDLDSFGEYWSESSRAAPWPGFFDAFLRVGSGYGASWEEPRRCSVPLAASYQQDSMLMLALVA